jgi:hypothetical protein
VRIADCALAAAVPVLGWYCLTPRARREALLRARLAANVLRGRPVAFRVTVRHSGPGPAFELNAPHGMIIGCSATGCAESPEDS